MVNSKDTDIPDTQTKPVVALVFWVCVIATILFAIAAVKFYFEFMENAGNIKGRAVMLTGVTLPAESASVPTTRKWLERFAPATPNCLCSIGHPAKEKKDSALLFCIGFEIGEEACRLVPDALPPGVKMTASNPSDVNTDLKLVFLLQRHAPSLIISPRTSRELPVPE